MLLLRSHVAVLTKSKLGDIFFLAKTHPSSHGFYDVSVSVDSGIDALDPTVGARGVVAARIRIIGFRKLYRFGARLALVSLASAAITQTVWWTLGGAGKTVG